MWITLTPFAVFLIIHRAWQADAEVPKNQNNINRCSAGCYPHDCSDIAAQGLKGDGVYLIYPKGLLAPVPVYCDMTGKDGPWTVFQKRFDGKEDFYRGWQDYKAGFGRANEEYWLGLQNIYLLTLQRIYRLRIVLKDWDNKICYVTYEDFSLSPMAINPEDDGYKLHIGHFTEGDPSNPAGDSLRGHNGMNFSTYDNDRDRNTGNCAQSFHGAFWYDNCHKANLNGKYLNGVTAEYGTGLVWYTGRGHNYSYKESVMMIAPSVLAA